MLVNLVKCGCMFTVLRAISHCINCAYRWRQLLPKLLAVDRLLTDVQWRERFVSECMGHLSGAEQNIVLKWQVGSLRGLRWEAVSNFCREDRQFHKIAQHRFHGC